MTAAELTEVPWTIDALVALGFTTTDAARLASRLPPIEAGILAELDHHRALARWPSDSNPVAVFLWFAYDLNTQQALTLASMGRGMLDPLVVLDAVGSIMASSRWDSHAINVACEWASERTVPRGRIAAYIAAGVPSEEAARFEAEPDTRPSEAQLQLLAALHHGGPVSVFPASVSGRR